MQNFSCNFFKKYFKEADLVKTVLEFHGLNNYPETSNQMKVLKQRVKECPSQLPREACLKSSRDLELEV